VDPKPLHVQIFCRSFSTVGSDPVAAAVAVDHLRISGEITGNSQPHTGSLRVDQGRFVDLWFPSFLCYNALLSRPCAAFGAIVFDLVVFDLQVRR